MITAPIPLTPDVAIVASGWLGLALSHDADATVYLLDGGSERALIDAGTGLDLDGLAARIRALGGDSAPVSRLLLTHEHPDHAAGAAGIADRFGCTVHASPVSAAIVRSGDTVRSGLRAAIDAGTYPPRLMAPAVDVVDVAHGDVVRVGRLTVTAIATPGHVPGHLCYLVEGGERRLLFSGDHVFWGGWVAAHDQRPEVVDVYRASMRRLRETSFDALLPGHLQVTMQDGRRHVMRALDALDAGRMPPDLLDVIGLPRVPSRPAEGAPRPDPR